MRLSKVRPGNQHFTVTCRQCLTRVSSEALWADLDGPPFQAYYCDECRKNPQPAPPIKADTPVGEMK